MRQHLINLGVFLAILLALTVVNVVFFSIDSWGILPRDSAGLKGILFSPLIHASFPHFFGNAVSFSILSVALIQFSARRYYRILIISWLLTGLAVWLLARGNSYHVGLSGIIYALWGYLICYGFLRRSIKSLLISLAVLIFYGGMLFGVLPSNFRISFESHLFGAVVGGLLAYYDAQRDKKRASADIG
uniref:rhomboid family intramembrane serine protease n=1 Tax=Thaumasiovibrio occultus TaxID=1891184 RepID=UPI000B35B3BE|nr:rhomboid family intramembrane serine protease [Thaumasiovibrio occultus]